MATLFKKKFMKVPNLHFGNAIREIGRNAFVDWLIVIFISLIVALSLVSTSLYLYWQISSGNFEATEASSKKTKKSFDEEKLNKTLEQFSAREKAIEDLNKGYSGPPDPSK